MPRTDRLLDILPAKELGRDACVGLGENRAPFPQCPGSKGCRQDCRGVLGSRPTTSTFPALPSGPPLSLRPDIQKP